MLSRSLSEWMEMESGTVSISPASLLVPNTVYVRSHKGSPDLRNTSSNNLINCVANCSCRKSSPLFTMTEIISTCTNQVLLLIVCTWTRTPTGVTTHRRFFTQSFLLVLPQLAECILWGVNISGDIKTFKFILMALGCTGWSEGFCTTTHSSKISNLSNFFTVNSSVTTIVCSGLTCWSELLAAESSSSACFFIASSCICCKCAISRVSSGVSSLSVCISHIRSSGFFEVPEATSTNKMNGTWY